MRGTGKKFTGARGKQRNCGLGDQLLNAKKHDKSTKPVHDMRHTTDFLADNQQMTSVVDESDFLNIVAAAHLENKNFQAEREVKIVNPDQQVSLKPTEKQQQFIQENVELLRVPRRPAWTKQMTKDEVEKNELTMFYQWRQQLSLLEENRTVVVTPFEKNLEFWRQLWRVVEFSDVIFQIVDARNPMLFFSRDLMQYVREVGRQQKKEKTTVLILNKADLVPLQIRQKWSDYFTKMNIQHLFFSALREEAILAYIFNMQRQGMKTTDVEAQVRDGIQNVECEKESSESEEEETQTTATTVQTRTTDTQFMIHQQHKQMKREKRQQMKIDKQKALESQKKVLLKEVRIPEVLLKEDDKDLPLQIQDGLPEFLGSAKILTRKNLLKIVDLFALKAKIPAFTVGTVGFPNIGKSSIINCLAIETGLRTAVGDTPGKTKHFQTIQLNVTTTLCDCPGLVFPTFAHCRADFVLNGILPVDKERDYVSYLQLLCKRIPARVFNKLYQLNLGRENKFDTGIGMTYGTKQGEGEYYTDYMQLLVEFEKMHGMERGVVGRKLVKDLFKGKLLWIALPPTKQAVRIVKMSDQEWREQRKRIVGVDNQEYDPKEFESDEDGELGEEFGEEFGEDLEEVAEKEPKE